MDTVRLTAQLFFRIAITEWFNLNSVMENRTSQFGRTRLSRCRHAQVFPERWFSVKIQEQTHTSKQACCSCYFNMRLVCNKKPRTHPTLCASPLPALITVHNFSMKASRVYETAVCCVVHSYKQVEGRPESAASVSLLFSPRFLLISALMI